MFSTSNSCKKTAACMVAMMMMVVMMMAEVTAMPKGSSQSRHQTKGHRKSSDEVEFIPLQIDPNSMVPNKIIRPLENSSISPWTYNVSQDASLYPPMLSEARCLLRGCLDKEGLEDRSLESRPILNQVLLLRRVKSGTEHSYHYRLESRLIAVGCTCVRPVIQHQH